jgi:hypothetical protein
MPVEKHAVTLMIKMCWLGFVNFKAFEHFFLMFCWPSSRYNSMVNDQLDLQFFFLICLFQFSTCFEQYNCINTVDSPDDDEHETWCHFFDPATKQWRHSGSPRPKKTRSSIRAGKVMVTCFFFYENGPLMLEWLETGGTVNANRYHTSIYNIYVHLN